MRATNVGAVTHVTLTAAEPACLDVDALVIAVGQRDDTPALLAGGLPGPAADALTAALGPLGVRGLPDEVIRVPAGDTVAAPVIVLTGVGSLGSEEPSSEALRRAAGAALRTLNHDDTAALILPASTADALGAVVEGALLGAYRFTRYRGGVSRESQGPGEVVLATPLAEQAAAKAAVRRASILAQAVNGARDLVNTPPRDLYPQTFAEAASAAATGTTIAVSVLDENALRDGGYGGIVGVGQGSSRPPRLVRMSYEPEGATSHVALVGKGITFDSGGLSIKPAKSMETMKCDMAGAAAVLHAVLAAEALRLPVRVTGWLALAENMPSGAAQRPSDVVTIRDGTTVEVLNTDAEGRLVLADALTVAREEKPDALVDIATLTGAQMIALGNQVGAAMGTEEMRGEVIDAAAAADEAFWPMPLPAELKASLKSSVADLANMGDRYGGMLVAGIFLQHFSGKTPWAHLDIAGPAFNEGDARGYTPKGGTGAGVRTLVSLLERRAGQ